MILKKRDEFWETRVEGNSQTWNALKMACTGDDLETALLIMKEVDIKLINKTLQMCYDSHGYRYEIPVFVINLPTSYDTEETKKPKKPTEIKDIKVSICF